MQNNENLEKVEDDEVVEMVDEAYLEEVIEDLEELINSEEESKLICNRMIQLCRSFKIISDLESCLVGEYNNSKFIINNAREQLEVAKAALEQQKNHPEGD